MLGFYWKEESRGDLDLMWSGGFKRLKWYLIESGKKVIGVV